MITGALIAALVLSTTLATLLFWQSKRAANAVDGHIKSLEVYSDARISIASLKVTVSDLEKSLNIVTAERDRLEFTLDTVVDQRDALLKEALENNPTPGNVASAVRNALGRLQHFPPKLPEADTVPGMSSPEGSDEH